MSLANNYKQQYRWRDWNTVLESLPSVQGKIVLDLGCGVGDLTAQLVNRGARVIGLDLNQELLDEARSRGLPNAEFRLWDLRQDRELDLTADGIWSSFTAAYFPDLPTALRSWAKNLKPGGWIALTEIDDLFGHEPLGAQAKALLDAYVDDSLVARRYDFRMGRKLETHLEQAGFTVSRSLNVADAEFSSDGPAPPEVVEAWRNRLQRMKLLHAFCGRWIDAVQEEFLSCLTRHDHKSRSRVRCCLAHKN